MEKSEISRLINSFNTIKGYFETTKKYMPQIAKLVFFIEEVVPLLNSIHDEIHQSSKIIPTASEKLEKVTSATEMAATEVMDIVDNVIERLETMTSNLEVIDESIDKDESLTHLKEKTNVIRQELDGSQDDFIFNHECPSVPGYYNAADPQHSRNYRLGTDETRGIALGV